MNYVYRTAKPEDRAKYLDFANMVFSMAHRPHDFSDLIPKVYAVGRECSSMHKIAVDENGDVRGLVAALRNELVAGENTLKTAYVGTVSVHPYDRGQGHMRALVHETIKACKEEGVDIMMLGGQRQRYEYYGFTKGGMCFEHGVSKANVRHALKDVSTDGMELIEITDNADNAIDKCLELYNKKTNHAIRSREDFLIITHTWNYALYQVVYKGEFIGYSIAMPGGDKNVSEFALVDNDKYFDMFVKKCSEGAPASVVFATSPIDTEYNKRFADYEEWVKMSTAQSLKVLNFNNVIKALLTLKAGFAKLADGKVSYIIDGEKVTVTVKDNKVTVENIAEEGAECITAVEAQHRFFDVYDVTGKLPLNWAPLPIYLDRADEF